MLVINSFTIHVNTIGHEVQHGIRMNSNTSELFLVGGVKRVEGDGNLVSFAEDSLYLLMSSFKTLVI